MAAPFTAAAGWTPVDERQRRGPGGRRRSPRWIAAIQLHVIVAWGFWAAVPLARLVHAWSIRLQYNGRPYSIDRRRFQPVR